MIKINTEIVIRRVGEFYFLIDPQRSYNSENEDIFQTNEIGATIWNLLPEDIKVKKEQEESEKRVAEAKIKHQKQEEERRKAYQAELDKKREIIYPNSPVTREIVNLITRGNEYPYSIEINHSGLTFHFENRTSSYVLRSHGLPDFDLDEERIFAEVLNAKLSYKYTIRDNKKDSFHQYGDAFDGFVDVISTHISTIMELKISRSF